MMRAISASTTIADPYRAALHLGQSVAAISPEVVFLFTTVHYDDWGEFMSGLYDGLGTKSARVIGASGDGIHELQQTCEVGAAVLALSSNGAVQWRLATAGEIAKDPEGAVRNVVANLAEQMDGRTPSLYFLVSDFRVDASRIETVIRDEIDVPVIGGMAGDDNNKMEHCCVFADGEMLQGSLAMLAADGPLDFRVHVGNALTSVGKPGFIDSANGKVVSGIAGLKASEFVEQETGKPFLRSDQGIITLTILNAGLEGEKKLRAVANNIETEAGSLTLHGGVQPGDLVQVCVAESSELISEVHRIVEQIDIGDFVPSAALIVSCAGRKWLLGGQIEFEVRALADRFGGSLPIAGFPSFGEIGPLWHEGKYTRNLFHNMTYVLLLFGTTATQ
jgi:hypothetical protein